MQFQVQVPQWLSDKQHIAIGRAIIRTIKRRTIQGISLDGSPFAGYSQRYIDSPEFKAAGKSASSVNLQLTKEMLNSMVVESASGGSITIGFDNSSAAEKADWAENRTNAVQRKFFGIRPDELDEILAGYQAPEDLPERMSLGFLSNFFRISNE